MPPRPSFDRTLLIPIAIGVVSILGIAWLVSTSDLAETFAPPTAIPTAVPFDVSALETQAWALFPSPTPAREETPPATGSEPAAETLPATDASPTAEPPAPSPTLTPEQIQPLRAGRYDDTHPNIAYDRNWKALSNPSTKDSYKGTIHMSTGIGNEASFRFTGKAFILGYKRAKSFGIVTVIVDGQSYNFHEQDFGLVWRSPQLTPGDHFVRIIHESGESINLDYIEILE